MFYHINGIRKQRISNSKVLTKPTKGSENMATNPPSGDGHRNGAIRNRSQVHNPKNDRWTKRDSDTGQFIDQKSDKKPFKGVRKEK